MTDFEPVDLLDMAEGITAGRLSMGEAERRITVRYGDSRRAQADLEELRSLTRALGAVDAHARATRQTASAIGSAVPVVPFDDVPAVAVDGAVRRRTVARPDGRRAQRPVLAFAVVLLLGAGLAAASIIGGRLTNQTPQPSSFPPVAVASPSPGLPETSPIASTPLASGPPASANPQPKSVRALLWTLSDPKQISVVSIKPGTRGMPTVFTIDTWADPDKAAGVVIHRQFLASPRGGYIAIAETDPRARTRLRVATIKGQVVWSDESTNGIPSLAWSGDGSQLAIAFSPEPWLVVRMAGSEASAREYRLPEGSAFKLVGFSADGRTLLAYDGTGEAAPWEQPIGIDVASGDVTRLDQFTDVAASNTTTVAPLVDPLTGRVLDSGGLAGTDPNWAMYTDRRRVELELPVTTRRTLIDPRWTDGGTILVLQTPIDGKPPSNSQQDPVLEVIRQPGPGAKAEKIDDTSWAFSGPKGTRCRGRLLEARSGYALVGLATYPSDDDPWMGFDGVNLISLDSGVMFSASFNGLGAFDVHSAGLID